MSGVHVDPDKLVDLASKVVDQPYGLMNRATGTIDGCSLGAMAFGTIGSAILGGAYEDDRAQFRQSTSDAAGAINSCAQGLAHVAKVYAGAEGRNADGLGVKYTSTVTDGPGALGHDGFGSLALGLGAYTADIIMFPIFAAVHAGITSMATLCITVFVAESLWMLTKPDDTEINDAVAHWRSAAADVGNSEQALNDTIKLLIDDAWSKDDGGRPAFDAWLLLMQGDLEQLKTGISQVPDVMAQCADHVRETNEWLLGIVIAELATMIALTALDVFFGAGEAAKQVLGAIVVATIAAAVASIGAIIVTMVKDIGQLLITYRPKFTGLGSGATQTPDFGALPSTGDWQADQPPAPTFATSPSSGTPSGPPSDPPR